MKKKLTKAEQEKLLRYYQAVQEAQEKYDAEVRRLKLKRKLKLEKEHFLYD